MDDVKGTAVAFIKDWMNAKAMAGKFCVSEYFDGNPQSLFGWAQGAMGGRSAVFDFTTHFGLQRMCDDPGFDMRQLDGLGYTARDPFHSATFVENPDTDLSPGEIGNNKLLAYAFILTTEGYPFVFHKDYSTAPGCYGLKRWIDNLVWIHENLAFGTTVTRHADAQTFVYERQGHPGLLTAISKDPINRRTITCSTGFGANVVLHDYTGRHPDIQTDSTGHATFTLSSNGFSSGQSYLCFSRAGIGGSPALARRSTTQTFFGARDLDIAAILNGEATIGRVWAAQGTPITARFRGQLAHWPAGGSVALELFGTDGAALASARLASAETVECQATVRQPGWQIFKATAAGLPRDSGVPFALTVTYTSTQDLAPV